VDLNVRGDSLRAKLEDLLRVEPKSGIEPETSSLPRKCSTAELFGQKPPEHSKNRKTVVLRPYSLQERGGAS
jgi:hypothetical protein